MQTIRYRHWKSNKELVIKGTILSNVNEESERIVVKTKDNKFEDIIKSTIIEIKTDGE